MLMMAGYSEVAASKIGTLHRGAFGTAFTPVRVNKKQKRYKNP
jgi:hypothetical protein